jgi:hypothetical protein
MARKPKAPPAPTDTQPDPAQEKLRTEQLHQVFLSSSFNAAVVTEAYLSSVYGDGELNATVLSHHLSECAQALQGDTPLKQVEGMLLSQAHALNTMFTALAKKATEQEYMKPMEAYTRLALKAQSQCRATLETLADIKQPRHVVIAQQANLAHQQQVNNGTGQPGSAPPEAQQAIEHQPGQPIPASAPDPANTVCLKSEKKNPARMMEAAP